MCPTRVGCPVPGQVFEISDTEQADEDERVALGVSKDAETAALCLSGGGIRSAAFCLGVIQTLADRKLLTQFHYLSTVSGGGYVGGWLCRWIASPDGERMLDGQPLPKLDPLRAYTNYLTPNPGPASDDTWQAVTIWLRNTLINWTLFAPVMIAAAALPIVHLLLLRVLAEPGHVRTGLAFLSGLAALVLLYRSILRSCLSLPSYRHPDITPARPRRRRIRRRWPWTGYGRRVGMNRTLTWTFRAMAAVAMIPFRLARTRLVVLLGLAALGLLYRLIPSRRRRARTALKQHVVPFGRTAQEISRRITSPALLWAFLASLAVAPGMQSQPAADAPVWQGLWSHRPFSPSLFDCWPKPGLDDVICPPCDVWKPFGIRTKPSKRLSRIRSVVVRIVGTTTMEFLISADVGKVRSGALGWPQWWLPAGSLIAGVAAYSVAWFTIIRRSDWKKWRMKVRHNKSFKYNLVAWLVSCIGSAALLWLGLTLGERLDAVWIVVLGPAWVVMADVLRSTLYVVMRREGIRTALDREWLGRLNGSKLRAGLGYAAAAWAVLFLPRLVLDGAGTGVLTGLAVFSAGPVGALLGRSAGTAFAMTGNGIGKGQFRFQPAWIVSAIVLVFIFGLFMLFGRLDAVLVLWIAVRGVGMTALPGSMLCASVLVATLALVLAFGLGRIVEVNRFSMHAIYANRLVRAFLGSARAKENRHPDQYTRFDPSDNIRMADLVPPCGRPFLFPVINVALNVTRCEDTARAERKAKSFTITPRHCGSWALGDHDPGTGHQSGAFVPTCYYAGGMEQETGPDDKRRGISLGTAMTISGAAVSPNMGYHSSMLTAFIMTLFNVRLGAWLPNPALRGATKPALRDATKRAMRRSSPKSGLWPALMELLGQSDDHGESIYLSDGGHFDNLGLYEMLRRRCARIVVIDADADSKYAHQDLARTLLHARIDFGIDVVFDPAIETGVKRARPSGAWGLIHYPAGDGQAARTGCLLYVKACLPKDAPIELQSYKALHEVFPHTPTVEQFFNEIDFETYRSLGEVQARNVLQDYSDRGRAPTLENWFDRQQKRLLRNNPAGASAGPSGPPSLPARRMVSASRTPWRLLLKRAGSPGR